MTCQHSVAHHCYSSIRHSVTRIPVNNPAFYATRNIGSLNHKNCCDKSTYYQQPPHKHNMFNPFRL